MWPKRILLVGAVLLISAAGLVPSGWAGSPKTLVIYNDTDKPIEGYWKANGCAGVHSGHTNVCHHETIASSGHASYDFPVGSSGWRIAGSCGQGDVILTFGGASASKRLVHSSDSVYCQGMPVRASGELHRLVESNGVIQDPWVGTSASPDVIGSGWNTFLHVTGGGQTYYGNEYPPTSEVALRQPSYAVKASSAPGDLAYYEFVPGDSSWPISGTKQGSGWNGFAQLFGGHRGVLYAIQPSGALKWYKHQAHEGDMARRFTSADVGSGWNTFTKVFGGYDGYIYAIQPSGDLIAYQHTGWSNGAKTWRKSAARVGSGWQIFKHVFGGKDGKIYAVTHAGEFRLYQHTGQQALTASWAKTKILGQGYHRYARMWGGVDGLIFAMHQ